MKKIIGKINYIIGYIFPSSLRNLHAFCKTMRCSGASAKGLKGCGKNLYIQAPAIITGKQNIIIGNNFKCFARSRIEAFSGFKAKTFNPEIVIGDDVNINFDFHLGCINRVYIGNGVLIGSQVTIIDHNHGDTNLSQQIPAERSLISSGEVIVEDNVWIGEKATILPGTHIGANSIIGANAVVKGSIPPNSVVIGIPGRVIKDMRVENG